MLHSFAAVVALAAICNDEDVSCASWASQGECSREGAGLESLCPVSCRTCLEPLKCHEDEEQCEQWARDGECSTNSGHMLKECPISCGICTVVSPAGTEGHKATHPERGPCVDHKFQCKQWAADGACNDNARFMAEHCPASCEICKPACIDLHADCPGWAKSGECFKNPTFILGKCAKACGVCTSAKASVMAVDVADAPAGSSGAEPPCVDLNTTQCHIWADSGECATNPLAVVPQCPATCGVCSAACMDHDDRCHAWAHDGKCHSEADETFMVRICPAACGICAKLDRTNTWAIIV